MLGTGVIKGALIGGSAGSDFNVTLPGSGMTVNVGTGQAMAYGHWCQNDASSSQVISAADPTNPRIDRVVLKHDVTAKTVTIVVKAGTAAPSPSAPSLTQTPSTWEMSLCQVRVNAGVTTPTSVTDERTYAFPSLHASAHATGGADPITPASIGAAQTGGSNTYTSIQEVSRALSGSIKEYFRMTASDGNQYGLVQNSDGSFSIRDNTHNVNLLTIQPTTGAMTRAGATVWDSNNDGSGSGLDADTVDGLNTGNGSGQIPVSNGTVNTNLNADKLDGLDNTAFQQFGTGGQKVGFKVTEGNALPVSGMSKGDVHYLSPFALP